MIKGLQKTCLLNYPPYTVATVFVGGCNFSCPFCHNKDLVLNPSSIDTIHEDELMDLLDKRGKWLDGVCITGGEPLLYDITDLAKKIKDKGFKVKVDTNGTNPQQLKTLIDQKLVDYVAMDIKSSKEKYNEAANCNVDMDKIERSIQIIKDSGIEHEFRTTFVPKLHTIEEVKNIGEWLKGADKFVVQNFKPGTCLDPSFNDEKSFGEKELEEFRCILKNHIKEVI